MVSLSSSFIRKRMISLATTLSVSATSLALAHGPTRPHHVRGPVAPIQGPVAPIQYVADRSDGSDETPFLSENDAAMSKMMADMTVKPTGDIDRDFVAMMVPHHRGVWRRKSSSRSSRRLPRCASRLAIQLPPSVAAPTQPDAHSAMDISRDSASHHTMKMH
jgi:hypothetical protein